MSRKSEKSRIDKENRRLIEKLNVVKPTYSVENWKKHEAKMKALKKNLS